MSDSFLIFDLISVYFSLNSCTTCGPCVALVALVGLVDLVGRELCPLSASDPKDDREINKMAVGAASTIAVCDRRKANGINRFHIVPPPPRFPTPFPSPDTGRLNYTLTQTASGRESGKGGVYVRCARFDQYIKSRNIFLWIFNRLPPLARHVGIAVDVGVAVNVEHDV